MSPEPLTKAIAVAAVTFERRDCDAMARFLADFGFVETPIAQANRYFRGYDPRPYCVELIPSERDAFVGFSLAAGARADLEGIAAAEGLPIEPVTEPGGGERVRLRDPDGNRVDLVWGAAELAPLAMREPLDAVNTPTSGRRVDRPVRTEAGPAPVVRIGHVVLQARSFAQSADWYRRCFGLIASDLATVADGTPALGFFRLDRGATPTDHHSFALLEGPEPKLLHVSTETIDLDAVGQGQNHLRAQGWTHYWGIGRHVLGSQLFDYWKDPVGDEWEHYSDGDLMTADYPTGHHILSRGGLWAWGDDLPASMRPAGRLPESAPALARGMVEALLVPPRPWQQ